MKDIDDDTLDSFLKRLHLANARRLWAQLAQQAETEQWSYRDFLAVLVAEEIAHRKQTRLVRVTRAAGFPFLKTIDDFDFTFQSTLRQSMLGSYLGADFVTEGRCLIFSGKPGRGRAATAPALRPHDWRRYHPLHSAAHFGGRFSANARRPSAASGPRRALAKQSAAKSSTSVNGSVPTFMITCLVSALA